MSALSPQYTRSLQGAFAPICSPPTVVDGDVGTTAEEFAAAKTLVGTESQTQGIRRVHVTNTHATQTLTLLIAARGHNFATGGLLISQGKRILPGQTYSDVVSDDLAIGVVGSGAATTYNGWWTFI